MKNLNIFSYVSKYDYAKLRRILNVPNVSFINEDNSVRYFKIIIDEDEELNGWINKSDWNNDSSWDNK